MVDDKDNDANDPWAGIDAGDTSEPQGDFSFSLDEDAGAPEPSADDGFPGVFEAPVLDAAGDAAPENIAGVFEEFVEESLPASTGSGGEDFPFAEDEMPALDADLPSLEDAGSGFADLASSGDVDAADEAGLVDEWLTEEPAADAGAETPLAVFPAGDLHDHGDELGQDREAGESAIVTSAIQIGTGNSGVMSPSDVIPIDDWADAGGTSLVGMPELDGEPSAADSADEPAEEAFSFGDVEADEEQSEEAPAFGIAEDGQTEFSDAGFGMDEAAAAVGGGLALAGAEVLGEAVAAAPVAAKKQKAAKPAKSSGGGIGQMIGIVLGGLMALPITYAILIWGFQKDPFKFTKMVPQEVAFLLPEKLQPGFRKPSGAGLPKLDQAASLDSLPKAAEAVEAPMATEAEPPVEESDAATPADEAVATAASPAEPAGQPAAPADDLFTEEPANKPAAPAVPEPEPLDYSALEAAIAKAEASFDELSAIDDPEAPARKKLLVGWYKNLAAVAEQMVFLENAAADSARPLEKAPEQMEAVIAKLMASDAVVGDLGRLSGMWLSSKKRPVDGAVLVATFNGARQVGPYWSSSITVAGKEPKTVAIISRREPSAAAGDQVLVTGVLFDGDALWAADCRRVAQAAAAEDLF
ncbi:MAG: hypothetical protein ACK48S_06515 [Planctomycetia bacterium]